jgi:hypothetical protein
VPRCRIRSIGVSNFNQDHLERIIGETGAERDLCDPLMAGHNLPLHLDEPGLVRKRVPHPLRRIFTQGTDVAHGTPSAHRAVLWLRA